jgi:hypothetical protein
VLARGCKRGEISIGKLLMHLTWQTERFQIAADPWPQGRMVEPIALRMVQPMPTKMVQPMLVLRMVEYMALRMV